jgi:hypothetical protein
MQKCPNPHAPTCDDLLDGAACEPPMPPAAATNREPHRSGSPCTGDELLEGAACEPHAPSGEELHTGAVSFFRRGVLDGRGRGEGRQGGKQPRGWDLVGSPPLCRAGGFEREVVSWRRRRCSRRRCPHRVPAGRLARGCGGGWGSNARVWGPGRPAADFVLPALAPSHPSWMNGADC